MVMMMPTMTVNDFRRITLQRGNIDVGAALRNQADAVIEQTWTSDPSHRRAYIYDYYSDDMVGTLRGIEPQESATKVPVDIKFIVAQSGSLAKDQVEYHVEFRPSHRCPLDYYLADYDYKYGMEYPMGMYLDIPDDKGVYRKWLICSRTYDPQFVRYSVLPCNYTFRWTYNNVVYTMDGVARLRNSYNSGTWTDYLTTTVENQDQLWLPLNDIATTIYYDQRFLISPPVPKPTAWKVSKIETLHPIGIYKVVVSQDLFNEHTDLVDLDKGLLIADYYKNLMDSEPAESPVEMSHPKEWFSIESSGMQTQIKIGGAPRTYRLAKWGLDRKEIDLTASNDVPELTWSFLSDGVDIADKVIVVKSDALSVTIQVVDEALLHTVLRITATGQYEQDGEITVLSASKDVEVIGL